MQYVIPGLMAMMAMNMAQGVGTGFNQDFQTPGSWTASGPCRSDGARCSSPRSSVELMRMLVATRSS